MTIPAVPPGPAQGEPAGVSELTAIRKRDANTESVKYSWPCADRRTLLALLDEERAQYISLVGQTQMALDERDAARQQLAEMRGALQDALTNTPSHFRESESGRKALTALAPPSQPERGKCGGCGNEIDPDTCGCGEPTNGYHDNHTPVPMGCDCYRSTRIEPDCAQGGSPADPERQGVTFYRCTFEGNPPAPHSNWVDWADSRMYTNVLIMAHEFGLPVPDAFKEKQPEPSPALREAAKAGAQMLHGMASMHSSIKYGRDEEGDKFHAQAALLDAFAGGK